MTKAPMHDCEKAEAYFANRNAFTTGPVEVSHLLEEGEDVVLIDVREAEDYRKGHLPGALNLPEDRWSTMQGLSAEKMNILYCYSQTCHLAAQAAERFSREGYAVKEMEGGFETWKEKRLKVET
jgi:rhodanese-related sulfurtransferase